MPEDTQPQKSSVQVSDLDIIHTHQNNPKGLNRHQTKRYNLLLRYGKIYSEFEKIHSQKKYRSEYIYAMIGEKFHYAAHTVYKHVWNFSRLDIETQKEIKKLC